MKYPTNIEKCIAALRLEFGPNAAAERVHREAVIPFVNDSYAAGLRGESGYPMDLEMECESLAEHLGKPLEVIRENPLLQLLIACANIAYEQGQRDAREGWI